MTCFDCPRFCKVDRSKERGFCGGKDKIVVAKVIENFKWEEPCISAEKGTLAIFFAGCNLRCSYCQNKQISHKCEGKEYSPEEFRAYLSSFDYSKYSALEFITPTHFSSLLCKVFEGFSVDSTVVWNSGGYENSQMIEKVSSFVDVFLPDFKYADASLAQKLSLAQNYFDVASQAIKTMIKCKPNIWQEQRLIQGVLVRHLVLPGQSQNSIQVLDALKNQLGAPLVSLMSQFVPIGKDFDRKILPLEYKIVLSHAQKIGLNDGYFQEMTSANDKFIPKF